MSPNYPLVPPAWWCGEFKPEGVHEDIPYGIGFFRRSPPKINTGENEPVDACCCCVYWLAQSTGEGFCRRYPPTMKENP